MTSSPYLPPQAAGRYSDDASLQCCQKELSDLLEHLGMEAFSVADTRTQEQIEEEKKAAIQKRTEELEKEAEESGIYPETSSFERILTPSQCRRIAWRAPCAIEGCQAQES